MCKHTPLMAKCIVQQIVQSAKHTQKKEQKREKIAHGLWPYIHRVHPRLTNDDQTMKSRAFTKKYRDKIQDKATGFAILQVSLSFIPPRSARYPQLLPPLRPPPR